MGAGIQEYENKLLIAYFPNKQPVGLYVTFPLTFTVACQDVSLVLFFKLFAIEQFTHDGLQFVHRQTTTLAEFHVLLTLASNAEFVLRTHPSISLIRSSRLSYSKTRPSSRSRKERSYEE